MFRTGLIVADKTNVNVEEKDVEGEGEGEVEEDEGEDEDKEGASGDGRGRRSKRGSCSVWMVAGEGTTPGLACCQTADANDADLGPSYTLSLQSKAWGEKRRINFGYSASHSTATQAECKWVCTTTSSSSAQPCSRLAVVPLSSVEIQRRMGAGPMKPKMVLMVPRGSGPAALPTHLALALCLWVCALVASLVL